MRRVTVAAALILCVGLIANIASASRNHYSFGYAAGAVLGEDRRCAPDSLTAQACLDVAAGETVSVTIIDASGTQIGGFIRFISESGDTRVDFCTSGTAVAPEGSTLAEVGVQNYADNALDSYECALPSQGTFGRMEVDVESANA